VRRAGAIRLADNQEKAMKKIVLVLALVLGLVGMGAAGCSSCCDDTPECGSCR
jgi:hypothetical protein